MSGLREALPNARLVVEIRKGTFEVRFHELVKLLPKPFDRVSLNVLSQADTRAFGQLCEDAGLRPPSNKRTSDLRDLLLDLFKNHSIQDRVRSALSPLFDKRSARRILTMTMLIATHRASAGAAFIRSVVGEDPFTVLKPLEELSNEIFEISSDEFRARSAVFSQFIIDTFIDPDEIADVIVDVTLAAAKRRRERAYRLLMSNMISYSSLRRTLHGKGDFNTIITGIYERLRYNEDVSEEPLYWLQYAIVMVELEKLGLADEFIDTAEKKASNLTGFETYQIDTQAFRIALLRATKEPSGRNVSNIDRILSKIERIEAMLADSSHRDYAVRVLEGIEEFVAARRRDLSPSERTALQIWLHKIVRVLSLLPDDFKVTTGSEKVRARIEAATASFLA